MPDNGWSHHNDDEDEDTSSSSTTTPLNVAPTRHARPPTNGPGYPKPPSHHRTSRDHERRHLYEEQAVREVKRQLSVAKKRVQAEQLRASEAESKLEQVTGHLKRINEQRLTAIQDAARANEELNLYKIQLEKAQQEIYRAQDTLLVVDQQRYEAEKEAAKARTLARKLNQEMLIKAATEEGRRAGLREGLERGRHVGIQEAQLAFEEMELEQSENEGYYHHDDYPDDIDDEYRPWSRYIESSEDIHQQQPPTPPPHQHQEPPLPVPPPPLAQPAPVPHGAPTPRSYQTVRHSPVSIPPDGYIPELDADHIIRIPPPHEFARPPPTPERAQSPQLPQDEHQQQQPTQPPSRASRGGHGHRVRHPNSSPGSTSTGLSQFDMVSDPPYAATGLKSPLSVIHEVNSSHTASPNPQSANDLRHQSSWGGSSHRSNGGGPLPPPMSELGAYTAAQTLYHRPTLSDTSSDSLLTADSQGDGRRRRSFASVSTIPDINIQPPSRPTSYGTPHQEHDGNSAGSYFQATTASELPSAPVVLPGNELPQGFVPTFTPMASNSNQLPQGFVPTGGFTPTQSNPNSIPIMPGGFTSIDTPNPNERPVIPDPALFRHSSDDDEDTVSSSMSVDTLTTPPPSGKRTRRRVRGSGISMGAGWGEDSDAYAYTTQRLPAHPSPASGGLGLWTSSSPSPAPPVPIGGGGSVSGRSANSRPASTDPVNLNMGLDNGFGTSTGKSTSRYIRVGSTDTLMTPPPGRGRVLERVGAGAPGFEVEGVGSGSGSKAGSVGGSKAGSKAGSVGGSKAGSVAGGSMAGGGTARSVKSRPGSRNTNSNRG